ncbi:hypothetical protein D3C75_912040 [compost metagenome]
MHQAFSVHALGHTGFAQQIDGTLLEHAGTNAPEYVLRGLTFDDHRVDASLVQQLAQQKARGAGADNGYLSSHYSCLALGLQAWGRERLAAIVVVCPCIFADKNRIKR